LNDSAKCETDQHTGSGIALVVIWAALRGRTTGSTKEDRAMAELYKSRIPIIDPDAMGDSDKDMLFPKDVGYGLVPRDYSKFPEPMFAPPSEMELIPESEWDARYDAQEDQESSLEHIYLSGANGGPAFTNLDQGQEGYCHTADTEVLTDKGFVRWDEYNWSDPLATVNPLSHAMEYQLPFEKHIYDYDGEMIFSTNKSVDFGVTPDHQMYVRKWDERRRKLSDQYSFVRAGDLGWYSGLLSAPSGWLGTDIVELEVPDDRRYDGDDFFAMLGLIISDGFAGGVDKTQNLVSFASFREEIRDSVESLASRIGFNEQPSRRGVFNRWSAGALANWVRQYCYTSPDLRSQHKCVPDIVKCASVRQIKLFLQWFDDRSRDGRQFYTTSKRLADDLQELHMKIGKRSTINPVKGKTTQYAGNKAGQIVGGPAFVLTVRDRDTLSLERKHNIETDRYQGQVYCAAVPNHTLITRRNGTTLISSNCWIYSVGHSVMLDRLKRGLRVVRLNPHSAGAIIKGGRNQGGWCGEGAQFVSDVGMAPMGNGPNEWPKWSRDLRLDTPEMRAEMAKHRIKEQWTDVTRQVWSRNLTMNQVATCGFNNIPGPGDYGWWSHSVCRVRWVRIERGSWGQLILNSWKNFGHHGLAVLRGNKAICDGALGIRTTT
jgi:hypothetical protein